MSSCIKPSDFGKYYKENMNALGLKTPDGWFDSFETATTRLGAMAAALYTAGKTATMAEILGATVATEKAVIIAGVAASGYVGAAIGSAAVASGRVLGCGSRIADMFAFTNQYNLTIPNQAGFYNTHPEIFDSSMPNRAFFGDRIAIQSIRYSAIA